MSSPFNVVNTDLPTQLERAIEEAIPGARATVEQGSGAHFSVHVVSADFAGKSLVAKQRMVYKAIAPFMAGPQAPVHAIDRLETVLPSV